MDQAETRAFTEYEDLVYLMFIIRLFPGCNQTYLDNLRHFIGKFKEGTRLAFGKYQPSSMGTLKWNALDHVVQQVYDVGAWNLSIAAYMRRPTRCLQEHTE